MGSLSICCPQPTAIASAVTTLNPCAIEIGQIQKMVFWRTGNSITTIASAIAVATWTPLLTSTTGTKAIPSPFVANVVIPPSEAREFGGGNETLYGAPRRKGGGSVPVTASMYGIDQDVITSLKKLKCETLEVLFINEANQLIYNDMGTTTVGGFDIVNGTFFVSDFGIGGFDDADQNTLAFNLVPGWSDNLEISTATTFLLDMVNA